MTFIGAMVGMIFGVMIVRGFLLDPAEEIGWWIYWHQFLNGSLSDEDFHAITGSFAFFKTLIGASIGLYAGAAIGANVAPDSDEVRHDTADDRACPFCAETVRIQALVCRHCKRDLPPVTEIGSDGNESSQIRKTNNRPPGL